MKKQLVSVVMVMSLAMITLNIDTYAMETTNAVVVEEEDTSTFFII